MKRKTQRISTTTANANINKSVLDVKQNVALLSCIDVSTFDFQFIRNVSVLIQQNIAKKKRGLRNM